MEATITKYARRCDVSGEGMNEGYLIGEGLMYIKYDSDMVKHIEESGYDSLDEAYMDDYYYYTEWECEDDIQYIEVNGVLMPIEDYETKLNQ